ncbi:MAG: hypothetical protein QOG43_3399 [Actinomycetota bacterium]|jgi:hypothetical protein|nr:hypothetical protein [Actinomycetota bacterium]
MNIGNRPWMVGVLVGVALAGGLTGCGGDDKDSADVSAACEAHVNVVAGFNTVFAGLPDVPPDGPPPPEFKTQLQSAYDANVATAIAALVADAPDEIKDETEEIARQTKQFRDEADPSVIDNDDFEKLTDTVDAYFQENCPGTKATVEAVNYAYQGLPPTLPAGTVRIELKNTSDEAHEMLVLTRKPGVTETFDQLLGLPEDQIMAKVDFVNAESTNPGQTGYLVGAFPVGDYLFLCSFGKGTTDDNDPKQEQPHFTLGMKQEVKVA